MIRKLNRAIQDFLRPKRLALGKLIWDRKIEKKKIDCEDIIKKENIKSILFLRYDGKIGDMVVNTLMFREVKKQFPEMKIGVVARGAARDIIADNPYVDVIYDFEKNSKKMDALAERIREEKYDLLIDFSEMLRVKDMKFINRCRARINMGLDKKGWNLFDCTIEPEKDFRWDEHITKRYGAYLRKLGIENYSTEYDVFLNQVREERAENYYEELRKEYPDAKGIAVLNPYGASKYRSFNFEKLKEISEILSEKNYIIVLICSPDKREELENFMGKNKIENLFLPDFIKGVQDSGALIKFSDLVITPDTSAVHMARAYNKPMIAVYRKDRKEECNLGVWSPDSELAKIVFAQGEYITGEEMDINSFNVEEIKKKLEEI